MVRRAILETKTIMSDLETLIASLQAHPNNWKNQRELLKQLRSTRQRRSDLVVEYGEKLLSQHAGQLGAEGMWLLRKGMCAS